MKTSIGLNGLEDFLLNKKNSFMVKITTTLDGERVTTRITGDLKNCFMNDCLKRGVSEAQMARDIIETYYVVMKQQPFLVEKEIPEIKNWIKDRIKL